MKDDATRLALRYLGSRIRQAKRGVKLDQRVKTKIIRAFNKAGLDGNGRFRKPQQGYSKAVDILGDFDIEIDDIPSSHLFNRDEGSLTVHVAFTNPKDSFSPVPIDNSMLAITYYKRARDNFEVLAYMS